MQLLTYKEFLEQKRVHDNIHKCYVQDCDNEGLYPVYGINYECLMCEEHSDMWQRYCIYVQTYYSDLAREYLITEEQKKND